nr:hypothetical protein [Tanacetum cinerariifolium]
MSAPTLTPSFIATITTTQQAPTPPTTASSTLIQDLPNFGSLFGFDHQLKTLEANFFEFTQTNQFAGAVSSILGIVHRYMDQRMYEAVKVAVQLQSDKLRDEAQKENDEFLKTIDENMQKIIKEQVKEQVKALVEAYESDKIILDTYGDTVTLKRRRDNDADKDEEPSAGSDRGSKRRKEGKEPDEPATAEEPMRTNFEMEEPSHLEFETGADDQPIVEPSQHPEWFSQQKKPPTLDHQLDWVNPKGQQYPHNLLKPLPLIPNNQGHHVIPFNHFINNDLEYLRGGASSRKYITSGISHWGRKRQQFYGFAVNRESARDVYSKHRIIDVTELMIVEWKADKSNSRRTLYFQRLSSNVYKKHHNPKACGRPSTRCQKILEEAQPNKARYVPDGTLTDVHTALDDRLKGIRMKYLPQSIWRKSDKDRAAAMIQAIDKRLKTMRIMRSLERFVGGRLYEGDFRMLQRAI